MFNFDFLFTLASSKAITTLTSIYIYIYIIPPSLTNHFSKDERNWKFVYNFGFSIQQIGMMCFVKGVLVKEGTEYAYN